MIDVSTAKSITLNGSDVLRITEGGVVLWEKKTPITSPLRVVNNVAGSAITVTLTRNGSPDDIDMEYSTDNVNWNTWTETNGVRSMSIARNGNLYLRGNNPNGLNPTNSDTDYYSFTADKKYAMAGDIRSLISHYEIDNIPNSCFRKFFYNSTTLDNASYMRLLAKKPGQWAYLHLFSGCTSLRLAPHVLPATNLVNENNQDGRCYGCMFRGCRSLTTMPIIKATRFGYQSCYEMFRGCSALVNQWTSETPSVETKGDIGFVIESNNNNTQSFYGMFYGCTSLVNAGGVYATKTAWRGYECQFMFRDCTSLTTAPNITFGSFVNGVSSCNSMFYNCTSLVSTPNIKLNSTTLYAATYKMMYYGCTSLTTAPEIKATTFDNGGNMDNGSLAAIFYNCSSLNYIKVHFTDWNSGAYTKEWTYGTKSTGTFYKPSSLPSTKNASGNTSNPDYIPYDWTVVLNTCVDCTNWQQCGYVSEEECEFDLYGTLNQLVTGGLDTRQESGGTVYKLNVYIRTGVPGCTYTIREAGGSTHTYSGSGNNSLYNYVVDRVSLVNGKKHFYVNATKDGISTGEIHYAAYDYGVEIIE